MIRRRNPFPGVTVVKDRHGKLRYRLRRTIKSRKVDCYLPGVIGSTEFRAAYDEATEGVRAEGLCCHSPIVSATYWSAVWDSKLHRSRCKKLLMTMMYRASVSGRSRPARPGNGYANHLGTTFSNRKSPGF